jgi:hypothetical protein
LKDFLFITDQIFGFRIRKKNPESLPKNNHKIPEVTLGMRFFFSDIKHLLIKGKITPQKKEIYFISCFILMINFPIYNTLRLKLENYEQIKIYRFFVSFYFIFKDQRQLIGKS